MRSMPYLALLPRIARLPQLTERTSHSGVENGRKGRVTLALNCVRMAQTCHT